MDLILDVKIYIASFDQEVWIKMVLYDDAFKQYAYTLGARQFIELFHVKDEKGTLLFGLNHSIYDQPSYIWKDGTLEWRYLGKRHRENDLPSVIYNSKYWQLHGKMHRENDLPASIHVSEQYRTHGDKSWSYHGKLHRENNLPAVIRDNGDQVWYYKGELHRENDLPAVDHTNGHQEWWVNGVFVRENDVPNIIGRNQGYIFIKDYEGRCIVYDV